MKLKGFYQDRSSKDFTIGSATFYLKPLSVSQASRFELTAASGSIDYFPIQVKRQYAINHVEGWENLRYEDGSDVEYSEENSIELLCDEGHEDLFSKLFDFSYQLRRDLLIAANKDSEDVKK